MADQVIQDIKDRLDIAEVVGSYIPLKRAGVNFRANCPFHNEKTPSFNVNPSRQIWHCFGCGEGGDIFSFVQKYEHLSFPETLQVLADKAGIALPSVSSAQQHADAKQKELREKLFRVNAFAAKFYHQILTSRAGSKALEYLNNRGLTEETIVGWEIGYAPDDFQLLEQALLAKGAEKEDLVLAGVSARSDRGTYDRFRGRVTFPILDFTGKVVGFSARILSGDTVAKYINSPESPVYSKSHVLFGLFKAKEAIRRQDYVVVVEGQMDCIKAHQAGFQNTVATSGTALTSEQLRALGRMTKNISLCFDADIAGTRAAKKAGALALGMGFAVKMITITGAKDPDELISQSPSLWEQALKQSVWFVEYFVSLAEKNFTARSVEQGKFVAQEVVPLLRLLTDPLEQDHYISQLSERFGLTKAALLENLSQIKSERTTTQTPESVTTEEAGMQSEPVPLAEKMVLGIFLFSVDLFQEWQEAGGGVADFTSTESQKFIESMLSGNVAIVQTSPLAHEALFMVESQAASYDGQQAAFLRELQKTLYAFHLAALKRMQQNLTASIRLAETSQSLVRLHELQREFADLTQKRLLLERKIQE